MASRSKQDATNYIYKELERHTAYERAQDSVRPFINGATRSLEDDLERLFEELTAARSAKTELKDLPGAASTDIDMKTD